MKAARRKWTEEEVATLKQMWTGGVRVPIIAETLGRTASATSVKAHDLGLEKRRRPTTKRHGPDPTWTETEIDVLRMLWPKGYRAKTIGERIGKSANAVLAKARRLGLGEHDLSVRRNDRPITLVAGPIARPKHCQFPMGHPGDSDFAFCGAAVQQGSSYCPAHHSTCYRTQSEEVEA